jgi:hypothetical protein
MSPIDDGYTGIMKASSSDYVPELSPIIIDPTTQAERLNFDTKLSKYLKAFYHDKDPQALQVMGPLTKKYAFYEYFATNPDTIQHTEFNANNVEELKSLLHKKDFTAIGDFILREYKEDVEKAQAVAVPLMSKHSSFIETESSSVSVRGVLLPNNSEGGQSDGAQQNGVPLYIASTAPKLKSTLERIVEEEDDNVNSQ